MLTEVACFVKYQKRSVIKSTEQLNSRPKEDTQGVPPRYERTPAKHAAEDLRGRNRLRVIGKANAQRTERRNCVEPYFVINAEELQSHPFIPPTFLVDGLIPQGVSLLCGPSKCGKSWLVLWMAMRICQGEPVWGMKTHPCEVLYLCLEDTYSRLQDRLYRLPDPAPPGLWLMIAAGKLHGGLEEQIEDHLAAHPATELIIIDTFQKIRTAHGSGVGVYAGDYEDVSALKRIADEAHISILLVHHLRKQKDGSDPFNQISGSNGILGAADAAFVMIKERRSQDTTSMFLTGRDVPYQELVLRMENCVWELVERKHEDELREEEIPPFLHRLLGFLQEHPDWTGTATQLVEQMDEDEGMKYRVIKILSRFQHDYLEPNGITFSSRRTPKERILQLRLHDSYDSCDTKIAG